MRLRGRKEVWEELTHGGWLEMPDLRTARLEVRLLDATVLDQAPAADHAAAPPTGRCVQRRCSRRPPHRMPCS
ncbi:hypothetical protein [Streptomyces nodosus]|uniref:hypothetical protein n=1 Tax=Streptomyces nodosus TaxID=40318 RepID=UPI001F5E6EC7|nr:hypothetical protein [Streptomyces nodosus]